MRKFTPQPRENPGTADSELLRALRQFTPLHMDEEDSYAEELKANVNLNDIINKDVTNQEFMLQKYSTNNGTTGDGSTLDAFITDSSIVKTGAFNDINTVDVAISGSKIQLLATGESDGSTTIANQFLSIRESL